jgi:hypothetical protein
MPGAASLYRHTGKRKEGQNPPILLQLQENILQKRGNKPNDMFYKRPTFQVSFLQSHVRNGCNFLGKKRQK